MDKNSEAWRLQCECRWCLQQTDAQRQAYYALVMEKRGKEAANALICSVNALRRQSVSPSPATPSASNAPAHASPSPATDASS